MSILTQSQSTQLPVPAPSPQTIQIELLTGVPPASVPASSGSTDVGTPLVLISFAILVKVTMGYLNRTK